MMKTVMKHKVGAAALALLTLGSNTLALAQGKVQAAASDPTRMIRVASPVSAAPIIAAGTASAGATKPAGLTVSAPNPVDDLPVPGEKEFNECRNIPANKRFGITLKPETELMELVGWIKSISCRPFILPANVRQSKVTIMAPEMVTASEAYRIFLSALESMGLTVQPDGKVLKIIESSRARESSIPVISPGESVPRAEQYVTRLLRLKYITPDEVVQVLNRLKGRDGDIMPYNTTNTLVITDLASNIRRMEEVVRALDVSMVGEKIWVVRLKNIIATEVSQMLQQVFGVGKNGPGTNQPRRSPISVTGGDSGLPQLPSNESDSISQIFPDDRTNSLILVASERTYQRVFALIKRLEQQSASGGSSDRIHVYSLENANADDIAQSLSGIVNVVGGGGGRRPGARSSSIPQSSGGGGGQAAGVFQEDVKLTPDKGTNSLIIQAGSKDYLTLRDVIRRLDIPRRQVFIEAMVMEVNLSKKRNLGLGYHGGTTVEVGGMQSTVVGGLKSDKLNSLNPLGLLSASGLVGGLIGKQFESTSIFGQAGGANAVLPPMFGIVVQALQTNTDVNVLQVPNILTTDNEKSTITVGQNLPFPSAITGGLPQLGAAGGGFAALQSVQRQDVQLKLDITPHVNASDYVRLEIDNEISDVLSDNFNGLGPATNKRTLKTVAVVRDQQPVVLGGIMRDRISETVTKIPVLGDIPILGYLFKQREKSTEKQMLLIILTPYVINDPSDLQRIFERKTRERREFLEAYASFSDDREVAGPIDYTRKRGALEEINRTAVDAEREMIELRAAEQSLHREVVDSGPVELPPRSPSSSSSGASTSPTTSAGMAAPASKPVPPPPPPGAPPG